MENNLKSVYDPHEVEDEIYRFWLDRDCFRAGKNQEEKPFTIVIPPPNVTGSLHMGHALDNTIQDVLVRWRRMQGFDALWLPGTDHAGIATQIRVEEHLQAEGITRHDLGREAFLERVWEWKDRYHSRILKQLQKLGVSCDWSRERFTLDEGCSRAVREVFVSLYRRGLIYRGDYMTNWCPRCHTALSDIEVEHEEEESTLTYIRYPFSGTENFLIIATTRPETMLGDTAVAVHPEDERYRKFVGKKVLLPLVEREIPIIADEYVDPSFGSGAVKITPGHDPNDWEIGRRHGLEIVNVIGSDARMTSAAGKYRGQDRLECRRQVVEDLKQLGLIEKIDDYQHAPGRCQRCNTIVEPLVSRQWFVRMKPLAVEAARVVRDGKVAFVPGRFAGVYLHWMENVRDWCISRQIWWGHRIPAWYCSCGETIVAHEDPVVCPRCGGEDLTRDPDVLDTWFSSALWPFSTMGWPDETEDLQRYFPTDVLVTGYDIIYFWVARMIVMSLAFMENIPFHTVYIHGLVRDALGRKMSKSLGNGIDPIEMIEQYGADTLRFTLITGQAPGGDQRFRQENVEAGRNFANKIWNVSRFVLMNLGAGEPRTPINPAALPRGLNRNDRWILDRYNDAVKEVTDLLEEYELGEAARALYDFIWNDFCDWYVEFSKADLYAKGDDSRKIETRAALTRGVLFHILKGMLCLLHPFMPFISEQIWHSLPGEEKEPLIVSAWPRYCRELEFGQEVEEVELVQEIIRHIRNLRSQVNFPPARKTPVVLRVPSSRKELLAEEADNIKALGSVSELTIGVEVGKPRQALTAIIGDEVEIYLPLAGLVNLQDEIGRLEKELSVTLKDMNQNKSKLENRGFMRKAPPDVVARVENRYHDLAAIYEKLQGRLEELKDMI